MDPKKIASDELLFRNAAAEKLNMHNKRTDWEHEEVKAQGEKYSGLFKCESCGSDKTGFI